MEKQETPWERPDSYRPYLFMRLYAEVATAEQATSLASLLVSQMERCALVQAHNFFPYWKIPAYYGFEFEFAPIDHITAFDCLVALCPTGWVFMGSAPERTGVWNPTAGAVFLAEQVRWANLLFFYKGDRN